MTDFITLTLTDGNSILVNPDSIDLVKPANTGNFNSEVVIRGITYPIQQFPDNILTATPIPMSPTAVSTPSPVTP